MSFRSMLRSARSLAPALFTTVALLGALTLSSGCASKSTSPSGGGGGTAKELNSGNIASGTTFAHTFATAGAYGYHCSIHASMTGTVTVSPSAAGLTADVTIAGIAPFPAASVQPGGTVTWHNTSSMTHTVTSN